METTTYDITAVHDLEQTARGVLDVVRSRAHGHTAPVLALSGELGAGKTAFMQVLAQLLGVDEQVTSPTFTIMKSYNTTDTQFPRLVHIDAYRVASVDELQVLQFDDLLAQKGTIIGIEWPEHAAPLLPHDAIHLAFTLDAQERRTLTVTV